MNRTRTSPLFFRLLAPAALGLIAFGSTAAMSSCAPDPVCGDLVVNFDGEECDVVAHFVVNGAFHVSLEWK